MCLCFYSRSQTPSAASRERQEVVSGGHTLCGERTSTVVIMGEESGIFRRMDDEMQL